VDETPEDFPSATTEVADQKVLGETPEAVKPCLEDDEQDSKKPCSVCKNGVFSALLLIVEPLHWVHDALNARS